MSDEAWKQSEAFWKAKTAQAKYLRVAQSFRPSFFLPITVKRDGSNWVCFLESDPEITNCPVAYGSSPAQALINFDLLWNGAGIELADPEEDEEQY